MRAVKGDFRRKLWISLFFFVVWSMWHQRNTVIIEKEQIDLNYLIKLRLGFWLKGWDKNCPFNPGEIITKLDCVRLCKSIRPPRPMISWCPPPANNLKWNVDGSSRGKQGEAGLERVLRDEYGTIKTKFAASVEIRDSNEA